LAGSDNLSDPSSPFIPGLDFETYLEWMRAVHPGVAARVSRQKYEIARAHGVYADGVGDIAFEDHAVGGRGEAYRTTQLANPLIRSRGIETLYQMAIAGQSVGADALLLDALGGNGTVARAISALHAGSDTPLVITADISAAMIKSAITLGLPTIRQSAAYPLFVDESMDAVIFAYGTHHIPVFQRELAMVAARHALKPGGRIVVQDFEIGTPTASWYHEVLDSYTETTHPYIHFTRDGMVNLLDRAGFVDIELHDVYDPCIARADSPGAAKIRVLSYLVDLFALKLPRGNDLDLASWADAEEVVAPYARFVDGPACLEAEEFGVGPVEGGYQAEYPRVALVATGVRPL